MGTVTGKEPIKLEGVEILGERQMIICNPNPERTHEDTVGGVRYVFDPFKKKSVGMTLGTALLNNARKRELDANRQATGEIEQYAVMCAHENPLMKIRADKRYVDPETGAPPRTKPWDFCPLVDLRTPAGMEVFNKGIELAIKRGFKIKEEVSEALFRAFPLPKPKWDKKKLVQFLDKYGGSGSYNEQEERLYTKALALFVSRYKTIQECGFGVLDEETNKVVRPEELGMESPAEDLEADEG